MKILLTAIGKRVQLIKYIKKHGEIIGADAGELAPAIAFVDKFYKIPKCTDINYIDSLLDICKKEKIDLLIPLYEREFNTLCNNREKFKELGTTLLLSHKNLISICNDKWNTYKFFIENNINTPISYTKENIENILKDNPEKLNFPFILKPLDGMGSAGVFKANNKTQLDFFKDYIKEPIIQEFVEGTEYTIDVLCDLKGEIISIVPRERIEVRSGEVSKSKTVNHKEIIKATLNLVNKLKQHIEEYKVYCKVASENFNTLQLEKDEASVIGPLTIQCIVTKEKEIKFIEINPRFGGGVPLSFEAGVDYGKYFKSMVEKRQIKPIIGDFKEITMLRYDEAIFM
ncbi:carbamoyl phosphate synthase-like protein [Clostridium botulinum]|uniref:ATP-grasp domain-containing protein n=1 Tax=Clostridium botulinum TaxID=1491 RepID=UPI0009473D23|nr:ATP-grasp domain-containing protein [Clostridium botulinum]APQ75873.1 prokaryotic glutathione synthetase, ATP-grasp domain protein [Clostridium botulinum]AUM99974.1 carbamoyl phosphate synthase-like protein [Clostridium botulinum]MBN3345377.1 carbamoyl phosphate synthase-like protein [Clostridium botulinum]MBN3354652.1 carbamoyl phosphate synthase-like protein [Clostridium botulinum]QDY29804.1 carbamoyl phosphate synthase-like protein [Clostridium botulinum]